MPVDDRVARVRLEAIARLGLLERAGDPGLTAFVRLATYVTGARAGAVHILDEVVQHRVAAVEAPLGAHPRQDAMCRLVVDARRRIVCADATRDARFAYSSFVRPPAPVRFYASHPLHLADGTVVGTLCAWDAEPRRLSPVQLARFGDLADQAAARLELTRIAGDLGDVASHDPLTGAVNRLLLSDRLAQAFARRLRHGGDVLVALVDVDDFKAINDRHGHDAGDQVLVTVARRLMQGTRAADTVARLGGDEFAVVAEIADAAAGPAGLAPVEAGRADRTVPGTTERVGATVGAALAQPGDDVRAALARADRVMYRRKPGRFTPRDRSRASVGMARAAAGNLPPTPGSEAEMADTFKPGDKVVWSSHGRDDTPGVVERVITSETEAAGRTVKASEDEPQYLVRSDKGGGEAVHKGSALKRR